MARSSIAIGLLAAACFSLMSLSAKLLSARGVSPLATLAARGWIGWALMTLQLLSRAAPPAAYIGPSTLWHLIAARCAFGFAAIYLFFWGLKRLPIADATALLMTNPVWCLLIGSWWFGERVTLLCATGSAIALTGVLLVAQPTFLFGDGSTLDAGDKAGTAGAGSAAGTVAVLAASISMACGYAVVQATSGRVPKTALVNTFMAANAIIASLSLLTTGRWRTVPLDDVLVYVLLLSTGLTGYSGQSALTASITSGSASIFALTQTVEVVLSFVWDALFFHSPLTALKVSTPLT